MIFYSLQASAQASLINVSHANLNHDSYQVSLNLDQVISYEVLSFQNQHRIAVDFYNTQFALKDLLAKKLDGRFIKTIRRITQRDNNLRIILELAANTKLQKHYSTTKYDQLFLTLILKNDNSVTAILPPFPSFV